MYKKKPAKKPKVVPKKEFKPRRVIINGDIYNVANTDTLSSIRSTLKLKEDEEKNQEGEELKGVTLRIKAGKRVTGGNNTTIKQPIITTPSIPAPKEPTIDAYKCDSKSFKLIKDLNKMPDYKPKQSKPVIQETTLTPPIKFNIVSHSKKITPLQNIVHEPDEPEDTIPANLSPDEVDVDDDIVPQNGSDFFTKEYPVIKQQWYVLAFKSKSKTNGLLKVFDNTKRQLMPLAKFPNTIFIYKSFDKQATGDQMSEYRIYFKTNMSSITATIYIIGISISTIRLQAITTEIVTRGIDIWKFRKQYDLEFLNYYMGSLKLNCTDKFIDRFKADYELYKNTNYFDNFIKTLRLDIKPEKHKEIRVLYLVYSSIEYEHYGYTLRTHNLLKHTNSEDCKLYGVTRYGYPYDRESGYYNSEPKNEVVIDGVTYLKILNGEDCYNSNNILEYLKKYIVAIIKLAHSLKINIIHGTTNYWNGIAALYASKYLGIKSIYEIRGFFDEAVTTYKPEIAGSDMIKMMATLEGKIFNEVNSIITINKPLKDRVVSFDIDEKKIAVVYNGVDTTMFKPNKDLNVQLRKKHLIGGDEIIIGYIGTVSYFEGIEYILQCLNSLQARFVMIGDGLHKTDILNLAASMNLSDKFMYLGKMNNDEVIKYYNMFDIVAYPRKDCALCRSTSSYKIFEAMSMGKAIIVSDLEACNEIIEDGKTGLYCKPDSVNSLLGVIKKLSESKPMREELGKNARNWVINNREWKINGEQIRDIYNRLM